METMRGKPMGNHKTARATITVLFVVHSTNHHENHPRRPNPHQIININLTNITAFNETILVTICTTTAANITTNITINIIIIALSP